MRAMPTSVTQEEFNEHMVAYLSTAQRGYVSKIPLDKIFNYVLYRLHRDCQWSKVPIEAAEEITWWAVYHHYGKWSRAGSLQRVFEHSIQAVQRLRDVSVLNVDGAHVVARRWPIKGVSGQDEPYLADYRQRRLHCGKHRDYCRQPQ
jgi:hypothetical protein